MPELMTAVLEDVWLTTLRVWPFLLISIATAAAVTVYIGTDRITTLLSRRVAFATGIAVLAATLTPFCSCGTTAVLLGAMAASTPWAPLVAFMVASPLTSPSELVLSAGLFGWGFALTFFGGTIVLGLVAGATTHVIARKGWLRGQARVQPQAEEPACATGSCTVPAPAGAGPGTAAVAEYRLRHRWRLDLLRRELVTIGRRLMLFFLGFTALGYAVIEAVPTDWLVEHLGGGSALAVPLAALIGIPAYLNTEASLPLVAGLMDGGMGAGPAMAFLVTGAGTSIGAITGLFVIARGRVVGLVVALLAAGSVALGWIVQVLL